MLSRLLSAVSPRRAARTVIPSGAVIFVTASREVQQVAAGEVLYAPQASTRLRVLLPASHIARHAPVFLVPLDMALEGQVDLGRPLAVVLAKLPTGRVAKFEPAASARLQQWLRQTKSATKLLADLSDDYDTLAATMNSPRLADYQKLLREHCTLTVPTRAFMTRLVASGAKKVLVIEDPYESRAARQPKTQAGPLLRLCWFGNFGAPNAHFLAAQFETLASGLREHSASLDIVAGPDAAPAIREVGERVARRNPRFTVRFIEWSLSAAEEALERADCVLLPHETRLPWVHVKSHNRLVETIRAGRWAVASPIPSYQELAAYCWLGDSLVDGVRWWLTHAPEAAERIRAGQAHVEARFSLEAIGERWLEALSNP